jgi:squalene-hopene/tetraprenyl-beta-curcumene cyclase
MTPMAHAATLVSVVLLTSTLALAAAPPARPLDPRINPGRMTESEPPPPPGAIVQPLPAIHRIAPAHDAESPISPASDARARAAIDRGLSYLRTRQTPSGLWLAGATAAPTDQPEKAEPVAVAVTALGLKAFAQAQRGDAPRDPAVDAAIAFLRLARRPDGTYGGEISANYVNACVASGLAAVGDREAAEMLRPLVDWLKRGVWDDGEGLAAQKDWYGGAGYGKHGRPDLSNTQLLLDALHDAGVSPDDPAVQATIAFVSRTQNLPATNRAAWSQQGSADGGFVYTPANGGESFASESAGEGRTGELLPPGTPRSLRSYGSMTYAGFKSLLYAGLARDDVRVRAAYDWVRRHLSFQENPGLGKQGLFYYYHAMARALNAAQQPTISPLAVDGTEGEAINWREALIDALATRQRDDGAWVNEANRWMEDQPELVTIYAVLALEEALKR